MLVRQHQLSVFQEISKHSKWNNYTLKNTHETTCYIKRSVRERGKAGGYNIHNRSSLGRTAKSKASQESDASVQLKSKKKKSVKSKFEQQVAT